MSKIRIKIEERCVRWKEKAKERRITLNREKKKVATVIQSRDSWKEKYQKEQLRCKAYQRDFKKLERQLNIVNPVAGYSKNKVPGHSYDSFLIFLVLQIRESGIVSLRSCQRIVILMKCLLKLNCSIPSINTIRNWENKKGYYQLHQRGESTDEYALIIDESFCVGKQVLLLVLGVNLSKYKWETALDFGDVELLAMGVNPYWKGDEIAKLIGQIQDQNYNIKYSTTDGGRSILKALRVKDLPRIQDCTHAFSKLIEKRYKEDAAFKEFCTHCSVLNKQCYLSSFAMICPPKLGTNSRFLNLYDLAQWGQKNLKLIRLLEAAKYKDQEQEKIYEYLKWLPTYQALVEQLVLLTQLLKSCFKILKQKGLSKQSVKRVKNIINSKEVPPFFNKGVNQYLEVNTKLLAFYPKLLCSSDIIESYFGRYKSQRKTNPSKGITSSCLRVASYGTTCNQKQIMTMMTEVKIAEIENWKTKNLLPNMGTKKKRLYKKCG